MLRRIVTMLVAGALLISGGPQAAPPPGVVATTTSRERAASAIARALSNHGGWDRLCREGVSLTLDGTFDLTTRMQGRSDLVPEATPFAETIVLDAGFARVAHTVRANNYFHSRQHYTEVFGPGPALYVDHTNEDVNWLPAWATPGDAVRRLARHVPQAVLAEALERPDHLEWLGPAELGGAAANVVAATTGGADRLAIYLDAATGLAAGVSAMVPLPVIGDTLVTWEWRQYTEPVPGIRLPSRQIMRLAGRILKDVSIATRIGARPEDFEPPRRLALPPTPDVVAPAPAPFVPFGRRAARVETVAPGVHLVRHLRAGFHLLFVEFRDFVVAVDAPTGWYEVHEMPPRLTPPGDSVSALGAKYLNAIHEAVPGKPVRHVVLTHHHSDHIGGIRPFLAAGAGVIAGASAARAAEQAARVPFTLSQDALTGRAIVPAVRVVRGRDVITDGAMTMALIELPDGNPKADHYLMVYLPAQRILYTTAFIYPLPEPAFPTRESIPLSIAFVQWLDQSGLAVDRILSAHGTGVVEPWHLARIRAIAAARVSRSAGTPPRR